MSAEPLPPTHLPGTGERNEAPPPWRGRGGGEGGAARKEQPGRPYKRPESVLVLVCTAAGEVLMLRRTQPADFWQSVTGSLRWGESALPAARRELYEETGIQIGADLLDCHREVRFPIVPAWRARYSPSERYNRERWFLLRLPERRLVRLNPEEHLEYRWLPWTRAAALASSWTNRDAIRELCGR